MRLWLATRVFFAVLFNAQLAHAVRRVLDEPSSDVVKEPESAKVIEAKPTTRPAVAPKPVRSDALSLLAALQREARFLDIVQEPLDSYSDDQIGAAARDVLRNCSQVLNRFFDLKPALAQEEGSDVEVPRGYDPMQYRIVGNASGEPPFRGKLMHRGWTAARCEVPAWTGSPAAANVVAPIEVEVL